MAEAVVEERPAMPTRFYCHMCNVEINIPNSDFTCPLCAGGFVEELPALPVPGSSSSTSSGSSSHLDGGGRRGGSRDMLGMHRLAGLESLRGEIATLLLSRNGPNVQISIDPGSRRGNVLFGGVSGGTGSNGTAGGRVRPQNLDRLDNVLLDFLHSLSGNDTDAPPLFFMGNPGDYAWGREGIDTIVTQLLNQMETAGPPPLAKEKINEIPVVEVTDEDVERKVQCSVCWEDFRLKESVRKLPCTHIYHEDCIVPWLNLHGTCPICRKSLSNEAEDGAAMGLGHGGSSNIGGGFGAAGAQQVNLNVNSGLAPRSAGNSSAAGIATSQQANQQNNVFGFGEADEDLD